MNSYQRLWWDQTQSDYGVLQFLRKNGAMPCQQLHYLQMIAEKIGKAYFWRTRRSPPKSHASFVKFLQAVDDRRDDRITKLLGFRRAADFHNWIREVAPLAYSLERLAPALAGDNGPNPEYPWPRDAPTESPASFEFAVWSELSESGRGRHLLRVLDAAVREFPKYA